MYLDSKISRVAERVSATGAGAAGTHPASGEGKPVLTTAPWSQTTATEIPESFRSGLPWKGCRERRGSAKPSGERIPDLGVLTFAAV